jgi:starch synthase (maltosyl-transferring)
MVKKAQPWPPKTNAINAGRVIIDGVNPEIDGGLYPIKRTVGERIVVEADIFTDSHDTISAVLLSRLEEEERWIEVPMEFLVNDRWRGVFTVDKIGRYLYTIQAWVDRFKSWRRDLVKKIEAGQAHLLDLLIGAELIEEASLRAQGADAKELAKLATTLRTDQNENSSSRFCCALDEDLAALADRYPDKQLASVYPKELIVVVDPEKARFSAWYEMFPRSCATKPETHGTLKDCERRLPYVASMGFDVLYLPPIHPIGQTHRKGKNGTLHSSDADPGSPWAIGSKDGGHKAIHPQLGTIEDFTSLVKKAHEYNIDIALDLAFQCSPDHPYVTEHPQWFRWRPDKTIQFAENPPKRYQDIYPLEFAGDHAEELWHELKSIISFWIGHGVRIFRVDNPHTKPFPFWQWVIEEIKNEFPEVIFLAEAFTRPKVMYRLAKLGFSQSYTYFAWRNSKREITEYITELTQSEIREYLRPNQWSNTPDIITEYLQFGGRAAFMTRLILAATLGANYGIYGPAFELCENVSREPGSEEYLNSEKYETKFWQLDQPDSLRELIARVNRIRRENAALQSDRSLRFLTVDNEQLVCYAKQSETPRNTILVVVNLDPHHVQKGWLDIPATLLEASAHESFQLHDLLTDARYLCHGPKIYVELNPQSVPAHIFRLRGWVKREQDFDYFM